MEYKRVIVPITPDFLGNIIFHSSDFPKEAKFLGAWFNHNRGIFELVYEHESFKWVPEGKELPRVDMTLREKEKKEK